MQKINNQQNKKTHTQHTHNKTKTQNVKKTRQKNTPTKTPHQPHTPTQTIDAKATQKMNKPQKTKNPVTVTTPHKHISPIHIHTCTKNRRKVKRYYIILYYIIL